MGSALIVSCTEKSIAFFTDILQEASIDQVVTLQSCQEARRILVEREFDFVVINAPLHDETGENLSRDIASKGVSQVILVVKSEFFEQVSAVTEKEGIMTVSKPINKALFWSALKLAKAMQARFTNVKSENNRLKQKIEDIKIVDRAKCILISHLNMNEQEAHRYIEKQAMDMRIAKREVAEGILKTYEN